MSSMRGVFKRRDHARGELRDTGKLEDFIAERFEFFDPFAWIVGLFAVDYVTHDIKRSVDRI